MKFKHEWIQETLDGLDAPKSRRTYHVGLRDFWGWYTAQGEPDLSVHALNRYKRDLENRRKSNSTISVYICAVKFAIDLNARAIEIGDRLDLQDIKQRITVKKIKPDNYSIALSVKERDKLFATCNQSPKGRRDLAILHLIFYAGLRGGEISQLNLSDYDSHHAMLFIRQAKHSKSRALPLHALVTEHLDKWLELRDQASHNGLFINMNFMKGRLSGTAIYAIVTGRCRMAGLPHYHPHDGRATYITMLHDNGVNIGDIQSLAGHTNANTTLGYVKTDFDRLRQAVSTIK